LTPFNVFNALPDNANGNNTLNSHGTPGTSATSSTLVLNNIAQTAENISCSGLSTSLTSDYNFKL